MVKTHEIRRNKAIFQAFWRELSLKVMAKRVFSDFRAYVKTRTFMALKNRMDWRRSLNAKRDRLCQNHKLVVKKKFMAKLLTELRIE